MTPSQNLPTQLAAAIAALKRVQPYADRLPPTAADEVHAAIKAYDAQKCAVFTNGIFECSHASYARVNGCCGSCGERL